MYTIEVYWGGGGGGGGGNDLNWHKFLFTQRFFHMTNMPFWNLKCTKTNFLHIFYFKGAGGFH